MATVQLPLHDPMYINGVMTNVWVYFFQNLAGLNSGQVDISELEQLVKQLPLQSLQGQQQFEINEIRNQFSLASVSPIQADQVIPIIAVHLPSEQSMQLLTLPTQEVILE